MFYHCFICDHTAVLYLASCITQLSSSEVLVIAPPLRAQACIATPKDIIMRRNKSSNFVWPVMHEEGQDGAAEMYASVSYFIYDLDNCAL